MLHKSTLACAVLLAVASAQKEIDFQSCDEPGKGSLTKLVVTPCEAEPCRLKKGSEVNFGFTYTSDQDSAMVRLQGTVDGPFKVKIPIPGLQSDFCQVVDCPVAKNKEYTGSFNMKIARVPISKTTVEMKVIGDEGLSACFKFPVVLV